MASLLVAAAPVAQTASQATVLRPCNQSAPVDSLVPAPLSGSPVYEADANGLVAVEIEEATPGNGWVFENDATRAGFSGRGYWRWAGPNLFSSPGSGVTAFRVFVHNPGTHQIAIRNRHDHPDASLENDCWMRVNGSSWAKTYSNTGSNVRVWNWHFRFDPGHGQVLYHLNRGINVIEISGRSTHFMLDRLHVFPRGFAGEDVNHPLSSRRTQTPVIGGSMDLLAGDPHAHTRLSGGSAWAFLFIGVAPPRGCGVTLGGLGMGGGPGELLLDPRGPIEPIGGGRVWSGASNTARFTLQIPNAAALLGSRPATQAALVDSRRAVLGQGVQLVIGDY